MKSDVAEGSLLDRPQHLGQSLPIGGEDSSASLGWGNTFDDKHTLKQVAFCVALTDGTTHQVALDVAKDDCSKAPFGPVPIGNQMTPVRLPAD